MSIPLSLSTNPVTFPVRMPGQASFDQQIGLSSTTGQAVTTTVSIVPGAFASAFSVYLSPFAPPPSVAVPGATPPPQPQTPTASIPPPQARGSNYFIGVRCVAPEQPVPVAFTATLLVAWEAGSSWAAGSIEIPLQGTTAQITTSVTTAQPVKLQPGGHQTVDLELTYQSLDPTPLQIAISPQQFPAGLTFANPVKVTMTPKHLPAGQNPKAPGGIVVGGPPAQVLVTKTVVPAELDVKLDLSVTTFGSMTGHAQLAIPYLSGFGDPTFSIKFDVTPLPIEVTISPAHPIVLIPGQPFNATVSIKNNGGNTTFAIDSSTLPHGLTLGYPSGGNGQTWAGGGTTSLPITLTAAFDKTSNQTQPATVKLNWSAYDGQVKNALSFDIIVLPSVLSFASPELKASAALVAAAAYVTWTLYSNGNEEFVGRVDATDHYAVTAYFDNSKDQSQASAVYGIYTSGDTTDGTWDKPTTDLRIVSLWPELCGLPVTFKLSTYTNAGDTALNVLGIAGVALLAAGAWCGV